MGCRADTGGMTLTVRFIEDRNGPSRLPSNRRDSPLEPPVTGDCQGRMVMYGGEVCGLDRGLSARRGCFGCGNGEGDECVRWWWGMAKMRAYVGVLDGEGRVWVGDV
ncbi:hypothetical protein V6N13_142413 [Hibiscus sabdariffa]